MKVTPISTGISIASLFNTYLLMHTIQSTASRGCFFVFPKPVYRAEVPDPCLRVSGMFSGLSPDSGKRYGSLFVTRTLFLHGLCPFGDQILFFVMAVAKVMLCAFVKLEAL